MLSVASGGLIIRELDGLEEYRACVRLQEEVWGPEFSERVPVAILLASHRLGGVLAGAWSSEGELEGFVFGMTGVEAGRPVHWSDMLAVRRRSRDAGLGTRLKAHQREVLLRRGVRRVYWTFDPLESRNAFLNLMHLGAVSREYVEEMYGESDSPLHRGLGTDRLVALWQLDSPRVEARMGRLKARRVEGERATGAAPRSTDVEGDRGAGVRPTEAVGHPQPAVVLGEERGAGRQAQPLPRPGRPVLDSGAPLLSVAIPADVQRVKREDPGLAREWRVATRAVLRHYLSRGWEVGELVKDGRVSRYLLARRSQLPDDREETAAPPRAISSSTASET